MDDYPDPEEEYEMLHADEFDMMREIDDFDPEAAALDAASIPPSIKRSLNFASPPVSKTLLTPEGASVTPDLTAIDTPGNTQIDENSNGYVNERKRPAVDEYEEDLEQFFNDDYSENRKKRYKPLVPNVAPPSLRDPTFDQAAHEADLSLIERIVKIRKKQTASEFLEVVPKNVNDTHARTQDSARIYRRLPNSDFQAITMETGERFYLSRIDEDEMNLKIASITAVQKTMCLLNVPYDQLKAQAEQEQIRQDRHRAKQLQETEDSGMDEADDSKNEALWVEKYKPRHYLDLLSDESTNRVVLQWIKLWDKVVFGREKKVQHKDDKKQKEKTFSKFQKKTGPEVIMELDDHGRPTQKVILLCGPPGLGKTTLAHIIAHHAGYNPVEMNASDDRSVDVFKKTLENATSMKAVIDAEKRPNCLIIDEIDGAPAPSINWLVNLLSGKSNLGGGGKKKKKEGITLLHRPVICICNELYTPALRPMRQLALVIQFPPTHSTRLAQRLAEVCRSQHLKADLMVLLALCEKMENDIRGCLSVLQFVRSNKLRLCLSDVDTSAVGQKDYQRSLFSVWRDVFSIPRPKKKRRGNPHELEHQDGVLIPMPDLNKNVDNFLDSTGLSSRYQQMLRTTESCGEYEKLTQGWFENYPNIKFKHTSLEPISCGLEWATFNDIVQKEIAHSQSWFMMAFLPFACVMYHFLFATHQWPKIQYPAQMSEMNHKIQKAKSLLSSMVNEMSPITRAFAGSLQLINDVLPYLLHIIQPNLRPVNTQLYSKQEKEELAGLINTMISYNLTYTQERTLDGQYTFSLDPNMDEIVRFPDMKPEKQLTYAMRQLVAREIELEKVRRAEMYFYQQKAKESVKMQATRNERKKKYISDPPAKPVPNHLQKLHAKPLPETAAGRGRDAASDVDIIQTPKDFFGRVVEKQAQPEVKSTTNEIVKSDIWFRFKEGYSNAVRRTIKMRDML